MLLAESSCSQHSTRAFQMLVKYMTKSPQLKSWAQANSTFNNIFATETTEGQTPVCWCIKSENSLVQSARQDRNTSHTASMLALSLSLYIYMHALDHVVYLVYLTFLSVKYLYSILEKLTQFSRWAKPWSVGWCKVPLWSAAYW